MRDLRTVEVGGSSIQYCAVVGGVPSPVAYLGTPDVAWLLAAPGEVDGDRVRGAHHIGWADVVASEELGLGQPPLVSMNDAHAAALGEWDLHGQQSGRWLVVGLGTGIGSAIVENGTVSDVDLGHATYFGPRVCGGCGAEGCLDARIGGHALSDPLSVRDHERLLASLALAITRLDRVPDAIVLAGGMARRYPELVRELAGRLRASVHPSAAEAGMKSAAPWGLLLRWSAVSNSTG